MEHETPSEQLSIDRFRAQMSSERMPDTVQVTMLGHREENGVEVALPFLKKILVTLWQFVPPVMAAYDGDSSLRLADAILEISNGIESYIPRKSQ